MSDKKFRFDQECCNSGNLHFPCGTSLSLSTDADEFTKSELSLIQRLIGCLNGDLRLHESSEKATETEFNASDSSIADWEAAIQQCDDILEACDDIPERAEDFAIDVSEKVASVRETIERSKRVTEKQKKALGNWQDAIDRCRN